MPRAENAGGHRRSGAGRVVRLLAVLATTGASAVVGAACGARGPLDDTPWDAGADALAVELDAAPVTDADVVDAGREGGIVACGRCVVGQCGPDILDCARSSACRSTIQCIATTCLGGGSPSASCMLQCAGGSTEGALQTLAIFQCVTDTCGPDCGSVLDAVLEGLDGLGGGGGGGGGGRPRDAGRGGDAASADGG